MSGMDFSFEGAASNTSETVLSLPSIREAGLLFVVQQPPLYFHSIEGVKEPLNSTADQCRRYRFLPFSAD
jgi:hypothetical protein